MLSEGVWVLSVLSIHVVKSFQSALLKLMSVLRLCDLFCFTALKVVVRMGR